MHTQAPPVVVRRHAPGGAGGEIVGQPPVGLQHARPSPFAQKIHVTRTADPDGPRLVPDHADRHLKRFAPKPHPLDRTADAARAARQPGPLERRAGRRGAADQPVAHLRDDLAVGPDIHEQHRPLLVEQPGHHHAGGQIGPDIRRRRGQQVHLCSAPAESESEFGGRMNPMVEKHRSKRVNPERARIRPRQEMLHRRVRGDRHHADLARRDLRPGAGLRQQRLDGFRRHRPLQLSHRVGAGRTKLDARQDILPEPDLRVERRGLGEHAARRQLAQQQGDRGRAHVDGGTIARGRAERVLGPRNVAEEIRHDGRLVLQQRPGRHGERDVAVAPQPHLTRSHARPRNGPGGRIVREGAQRSAAQLDFAPAAEPAAAAPRVERKTAPGQHRRQRQPVVAHREDRFPPPVRQIQLESRGAHGAADSGSARMMSSSAVRRITWPGGTTRKRRASHSPASNARNNVGSPRTSS